MMICRFFIRLFSIDDGLILEHGVLGDRVDSEAVGGHEDSRAPLDEGFGAEVPHTDTGDDGDECKNSKEENRHSFLDSVFVFRCHNFFI